jgi:hypothetical protein
VYQLQDIFAYLFPVRPVVTFPAKGYQVFDNILPFPAPVYMVDVASHTPASFAQNYILLAVIEIFVIYFGVRLH